MELKINKDKRLLLKITVVVIIFVAIKMILYPDNTINWNFKGPVEKIRYDKQGFSHVRVNGKAYDLSNTIWNDYIKIHEGDTVIKQKGDLRIKLIRRNTKDTIFFDGNNESPVSWQFHGVVYNVIYEHGSYMYVILNGREYYFDDVKWNFSELIYKGDSLVKIKGEERIKIIRPQHVSYIYMNGR